MPHVPDIWESILALIPTKYVLDFWPGFSSVRSSYSTLWLRLIPPRGNENFLFFKPCNKLFDTCSGAEIVYKLFVACATLFCFFFLYFKAQLEKREIIKRLVYPKRATDYMIERGIGLGVVSGVFI